MTVTSGCQYEVLARTEMFNTVWFTKGSRLRFVFRANGNRETRHKTLISFLEGGYKQGYMSFPAKLES